MAKLRLYTKLNPYYLYSARKYPCECSNCFCPSAGGRAYTFRYIGDNYIYYDIPKCASTTVRHTLFGGEQPSMNWTLSPPRRLFSFSFVRNPWDRAVSNWKMFTTNEYRINQLEAMGGHKDMGLFEFLEFTAVRKNHHWLPQTLFVPSHITFVGRLESFADDFGFVLSLLGRTAPIKQMNKTKRSHYRDYYDEQSMHLLSRLYSDDIARFGYTF
jgi:hypothetical protein